MQLQVDHGGLPEIEVVVKDITAAPFAIDPARWAAGVDAVHVDHGMATEDGHARRVRAVDPPSGFIGPKAEAANALVATNGAQAATAAPRGRGRPA